MTRLLTAALVFLGLLSAPAAAQTVRTYSDLLGLYDHTAGEVWNGSPAAPVFGERWAFWAVTPTTVRLYHGFNYNAWQDQSQRYYEQLERVGEWWCGAGWSLAGEQQFLRLVTRTAHWWRDGEPVQDLTAQFKGGPPPMILEQIPTVTYHVAATVEIWHGDVGPLAVYAETMTWQPVAMRQGKWHAAMETVTLTDRFEYLAPPPGFAAGDVFVGTVVMGYHHWAISALGTYLHATGVPWSLPEGGTLPIWRWQ